MRERIKELNSLYQRFIYQNRPYSSAWDPSAMFLQKTDTSPYRSMGSMDLVLNFTNKLRWLTEDIRVPFTGNWMVSADLDAYKELLQQRLSERQRVANIFIQAGVSLSLGVLSLLTAFSTGMIHFFDPSLISSSQNFVLMTTLLIISCCAVLSFAVDMYLICEESPQSTNNVLIYSEISQQTLDIITRAERAGMIGPVADMIPVPLENPIPQVAGLG